MKKIKFTLKIASIIIAMLFVGLFVSAKWNQLWLYDGWPGAWGSPKWLVESDGETSYDMEFVLMLIWVYGIMLSAVSIILYFKHKNKKLGENNDQIIDDQIDNQEINLAESISRTDEKGRKSGYKQLIMEITNRLSKIRKGMMIETQIIETKSDSICFLKKYYRDFKENGDKWENISLENFLKSLVTYTEDIDGYYANINKNELIGKATWRTFADILSGAAVYE